MFCKTFVICGSLTHRESIWDPPAAAISHSHAWDCHCPIYCRFSPRILSISYFCPRILLTAFFFKEYFWSLYIFQNTQNTHQNHDFHWHCPIYCLSPNSFDHFLLSQNTLIASFSLLLLVSYSFLRILGSLIPLTRYLIIYFILRILLVSYFVLSLTNKILIIYL